MSKHRIEKRDQELVEQFRLLFGDRYRKQKARRRLFVKLLLGVSLCFVSVYIMLNREPISDVSMYQSKAVMIKRPGPIALAVSGTGEPLSAEQEKIKAEILIKKVEQLPPRHMMALPEKKIADSNTKASVKFMPASEVFANTIPEKKLKTGEMPEVFPDPAAIENTVKEIRPKLKKPDEGESNIRIAEIKTCLKVEDRKAVAPQNVFSLQKDSKPYVWMDVRSEKLPNKLKHVYYCNGRRYCSVSLPIRFPRTRTWSNVTLRHASEVGQWRVDVLSKSGVTLSQIEFTVVQ